MVRVGSLCSGYEGLGLGVCAAFGWDPWQAIVWHADNDKAATRVLAHRFSDVPNLGDITAVDWAAVPPVDVLIGGTPCQDLSHAGRRGGMKEGTRSNLWVQMREAIAVLRPRMVIWENVAGALSADADSEMEPCQGCVGDRAGEPVLRALGRVVGDLSTLGYDSRWATVPASDIGACHRRERVFLAAVPTGVRFDWPRGTRPGGADLRTVVAALASYADGIGRRGGPQDSRGKRDLRLDLLPDTDRARLERRGHPERGRGGQRPTGSGGLVDWGQYRASVQRWEAVLGRPAPDPITTGARGGQQLSGRLTEWMMGLPEGWITDVPGISNNDALKLSGNGVVPQQTAYALQLLTSSHDPD
jgi:DNA (cytosine-5)-methyltransferase 1